MAEAGAMGYGNSADVLNNNAATCAFQESLTNLVFTVGQNEAEYGASQHNAAAQAQIRIAQIGRARFLSEAR